MIMSNTLLGLFQSQNSCFFSFLFLFLTDVLLFSFSFSSWDMFHFSLSLSLPDRWIRADSGPKLLTNFNFPAPSTGRANFQHLLIDNFLPSIDFSCWFIFLNQEIHKNLFNFQIRGVLILQNSIIKEVVGVFQPMMRMHPCIPSLVRMEKNMKYSPFLLVVIQPARADSVAQRIDAKNHSCAGQNKIVIMMFQPMMTRKPCDCTTILHERSWKVPKSAKLGRSKYWSVIVTLTETQTHKYIHYAHKRQIHNKEQMQPDTKCARKIHPTTACYSYITKTVVSF